MKYFPSCTSVAALAVHELANNGDQDSHRNAFWKILHWNREFCDLKNFRSRKFLDIAIKKHVFVVPSSIFSSISSLSGLGIAVFTSI